MIRVLNILGSLEPGGMETSVMNYYRHIDRSVVQYDFLLTEGNSGKRNFESEAISLGARIYKMPSRAKHPLRHIKTLFKILDEAPDIRIIHTYQMYSIAPAMDCVLTMLKKVPVRFVYSSGDMRNHCPTAHWICRPIVRVCATHRLAGSLEAGISMFGNKTGDRLIKVPRARDLSEFHYNPERRHVIRQELELDNNFVIINVGRLMPQKNQAFLLDAFALALKAQPNMVLLIAGDGHLHPQMVTKANELGLGDSVRFLGECSNIPDLLQASDLFVLPSLFEGLPGAAVEAQAAGLPCLLSDTITSEAKLIDCLEFLPINNGPEIWASKIPTYRNHVRRDTSEDMRRAGYDIREAAKWLTELYINALS